jgi:putative NADH-flavin reductase
VRVAVFGSTGRTGRLLVDAALERGHDVVALTRSPDPGLPARAEIVVGDARDPEVVREVVDGVDAVASVLAIQAGTEPTTMLSDATRTIAEVMGQEDVHRLVITTNSTVFTDREIADPFRIVTEEHRRNVAMLRGTTLDWTVLAPGLLRDGEPGDHLEVVLDAAATGTEISRTGLAYAVLDAIRRSDWSGRVIGVADTTPGA